MLPSITRTRPTRQHPILLLILVPFCKLLLKTCHKWNSHCRTPLVVVRGCVVACPHPLCHARRCRRLRRGLSLHSSLPSPLLVCRARLSRSLSSEALSPLVVPAHCRSRSSRLSLSEAASLLIVILSVALVVVGGCVTACCCIRRCPCLRLFVALVHRALRRRRLCRRSLSFSFIALVIVGGCVVARCCPLCRARCRRRLRRGLSLHLSLPLPSLVRRACSSCS